MKSLIKILLTLVMLFYVSASAETWAVTVPLDENTQYVINIIKVDNSFFITGVQLDKTSNGYKYVEKDGMYIIDENGEAHNAQIVGNKLFYQLVPGGATIMLSKVEDYDISFSTTDGTFNTEALIADDTSENNPITIPAGVYTAGEDFPAGTYRIELENEKNTGVIVLYENMEDTKRAFSYLHEYSMTKNSPVVGKMIIEPGNVLDIRNTVIILLPYEGLK